MKDSEYLLTSWHPSTRPEQIDLESDPNEWLGLRVTTTRAGRESDQQGEVTFRAHFKHQGEQGELVEKSRFVCEDGHWFYLDGELQPSSDGEDSGNNEKVGRNTPCPCGSGKKYKRCCGL